MRLLPAIFILLVLFSPACSENSQKYEVVKIREIDFFKMLSKEQIESFSVIEKKEKVNVYLKKDIITEFRKNGMHKFDKINVNTSGHQMEFKIVSGYSFANKLNNFYKQNPQISPLKTDFIIVNEK